MFIPEASAVLSRHPDLKEFASRVTDFLDIHLPEPMTEETPRPCWLGLRKRAAQAGLTGFDLGESPDAVVPPGLGHVAQGLAMFLAGRLDCDAREVFSSGHGAMALRHGTPDVARAVRERVVEQGGLAGVASSEPHSGSDLRGLRTVAVDHGDHLLLSGVKGLVSRVEEATGFVVFCKVVEPARAAAQDTDDAWLREVPLSALWLPTATGGVLTRTTAPLGLRGWSLGHLHFDNVRVGKEALLGAPGDGRRIFDTHFSGWRLMMALVCLGAATAAIEETMTRARGRSVGRTSLASVPSVVARLGTAAAEVQAATAWCFSLLERIGQDGDDTDVAACSAAKALATDTAYRAVDIGLQLHGSDGYTRCTPMEKRLRDIRGLRIADGPNDTLYGVLAHSLLADSRPGPVLVRQRRA